MDLNPAFLKFLKESKAAAKHMAAVIKEYNALQAEVPQPSDAPDHGGPQRFEEGGTQELTTPSVAITNDELDAIVEESADAAVVEKFVAYVQGFVSGIMLVA